MSRLRLSRAVNSISFFVKAPSLSATLFDWVDVACDLVLHVACTTQYPLFAEAGSKQAA
jgi:hypothetical protein